jgi:hypothetical protein
MDSGKITAAYKELQQELLFGYQPDSPPDHDTGSEQQKSHVYAPSSSSTKQMAVTQKEMVDSLVKQQLQSHQQALSEELSRKIAEDDSFLCDNCGEEYATFFCLQVITYLLPSPLSVCSTRSVVNVIYFYRVASAPPIVRSTAVSVPRATSH